MLVWTTSEPDSVTISEILFSLEFLYDIKHVAMVRKAENKLK